MTKLAFGYVRVSKEKAGQVSPSVQRNAIAETAELRRWEVVRYFEDIDKSATRNRPLELPGFSMMVELALQGGAEAILFYRVDRAVREHSGEFDILVARLKQAGVEVGFTNRQYDNTPEGQFAFDLDIALSRLEVRRLGSRMKDMHAQLARQGKYAGNQPPFGWERIRDPDGQQRLVLAPAEAAWRAQAHEWYQAGWNLRQIARELNGQGVETRRGAEWTAASVRRMLDRPMQVGARVLDGEEYSTGRIEPLISRETYERTMALLEARKGRSVSGRPSERPIPPGLLVCGTCGARLYAGKTAASSRDGAVTYYSCTSRTRGGLCVKGPYIRESVVLAKVEPQLMAELARITLRAKRDPAAPDVAPLRAEAEVIEISLGRLACAYAEGSLPESEYLRASDMQRRKLAKIHERIRRTIGELEKAALRSALGPVRLTPELWGLLPTDAKQQLYALAIERIIVNVEGEGERVQVLFR